MLLRYYLAILFVFPLAIPAAISLENCLEISSITLDGISEKDYNGFVEEIFARIHKEISKEFECYKATSKKNDGGIFKETAADISKSIAEEFTKILSEEFIERL